MSFSRVIFAVVPVWLIVSLSGCASLPAEPSASTILNADDRAFCVSETNRYRAIAGTGPVTGSETIEAYADRAAASDHGRNRAHDYSRGLHGPKAIAWAENSAIRWPLNGGSARQAIATIIAAFWAEGPGGGHYETMRNSQYGAVGCGGYTKNGAFTFVQHFRTSE